MSTVAKNHRVEFRCTEDQRSMIEKAVSLTGRSVTDFVLSAVQEKAMRIITEIETIRLNARDSRILAAALIKPPAPNERLQAAAERHRQLIAQDDSVPPTPDQDSSADADRYRALAQ